MGYYNGKPVNLIELCGGNTEAKGKIIKILHTDPRINEDNFELATLIWQHGFSSCLNLIIEAIENGIISINILNANGEPEWGFTPTSK